LAEKKLRVHDLAKELLVESKTIIEKCHAEGIEVKNHNQVVTLGLAATIREWFSDGAHSTTLEESARVDIQAEQVKARRRRKKATQAEEGSGTAVATMEAPPVAEAKPAEPAQVTKKPSRKSPAKAAAEAPGSAAVAEAPVAVGGLAPRVGAPVAAEAGPAGQAPVAAEQEPAGQTVAEAPSAASAPAEEARPAESPAPPKPMAGPQNIPAPAKLTGPKVIRFDRPEYVEPPRPSRPFRAPGAPTAPGVAEETEDEAQRRRGARGRVGEAAGATVPGKRVHPRRAVRDVRQEVNEKFREWRDRDLIERRERLDQASGKGIGGLRAIEGKQAARRMGPRQPTAREKKNQVELTEPIRIKDLSQETGIAWVEIQRKLLDQGVLTTINSAIDAGTAQLIAADYGIELTIVKARNGMEILAEEFAALERKQLEPRPPVVTVLGHVDHGKTSLLDRIRQTNVAKGEAGGITQHIGAYRVQVGEKWVTFLDTPGHAAFTAMRARGANLTDVVVLVVAADDGVMPTTIEAINHARAANCTIVVALNKIDLSHDVNKLYGELAEQGLTPAAWGGTTDVVHTSAVTGEGITDLLEHLATLSELMELRADPTLAASGTVIEAERSEEKGCVARVLVQEGTLKVGQAIVCGTGHGRVRSLRDDHGKMIKRAGPATPVEVTGLNDVPSAGDRFYVLDSARRAKETAEEMTKLRRERELVRVTKATSLESLLAGAEAGEIPELRVIIRADVQGSVDVLKKTLGDIPSDQVKLNILHAGVGTVTESDVVLAQASEAIIVGFNVVADGEVTRMADEAGVDIRSYRVIYNLLDDIRKALEGLLAPEEKIELRGRAEVREVFTITGVGRVAGCMVREGTINRNHLIRIVRDGVIVKDGGALESLRRFKDDVKEVRNGFECGVRVAAFNDVKPGDVIEAYERTEIAQVLG
jgi:translation initiation factor IF-2